MKYKALKKKHDELEAEVMMALLNEVLESETESKYMDTKVIKVSVFGYEELGFINDRLTFMDNSGHHYDVYSECSLEDLIDILSKI